MERRSKIINGKTKYLNSLSASIVFTEDSKKQILDLSAFKNMSEQQNGVIRLPRSTLLIGDKLYNNVWHPADELQKSYMTMEHQPFIMNHGEDIEDEIGFMEDAEYDPETKKLTAIPVLNLNTTNGMTALNHMRNRLLANKAPETSVGFWATEHMEEIPLLENAQHVSARDWEFDHNSLVTRGAGNPEMGIGIGLSKSKTDLNFKINVDTSEVDGALKKLNELGDKERMGTETPIDKPKPEPEKFTMSREEFHAAMKEELAKQAEAKKTETKTIEADEKDKKIAELEKQLSTRTTATRDNMVTNGAPGPVNPKAKAIRSQLIGMAVIKTLAQTDSDVHIHYVNENGLPPGAR